jgi:hypothetical protein
MTLTIIYSKSRDQWSFMSHEGPGAPVSKEVALNALHKLKKEVGWHEYKNDWEFITWKFEV